MIKRLRSRWRTRWAAWRRRAGRFIDAVAIQAGVTFSGMTTMAWRIVRILRFGRARHLLEGIPALLAVAGCVAVFLFRGEEVTAAYQQQTEQAFRSGDYVAARIGYERLTHLLPDQPEPLYGLARTSAANGDEATAAALLQRLAPADRQGYGPAHLWQAQKLLAAPRPNAKIQATAELHLRRALQANPGSEPALTALGQLCLNNGRLGEAEKYLAAIVGASPEQKLTLARIYALQGKRDPARQFGSVALQAFRYQAEANVDNHAARFNWAAACSFLGDYPAAVDVLKTGLTTPKADAYRRALADLYLAWSDAAANDPRISQRDRLALLEKGLTYEIGHPALLRRMLALMKGPQGGLARESLTKLLASGQSPALTHLLLGLDAKEQGKTEECRRHFEQAHQLDPRMPAIANNFAWSLAHVPPVDLPRALTVIDAVVQQWPKDVNYRETRGEILAKMGRWQEALADLEAALPQMQGNRNLHLALAETYDHLKLPEMAAEHRRRAEAKPVK